MPHAHKLILRSSLPPGDIVMLTAALRDLHRCHPGEFLTDVRTSCPALWEHNPCLTPLDEADPGVHVLDAHYPLINRCNENSKHFLFGYCEFLNGALGTSIVPTEFRGDLHLSAEEKGWISQFEESEGGGPYWIVNAGGKSDYTIKHWQASRYQAVVDHFQGRVRFVQVGEDGHTHPALSGVLDLRGKTDLRQLVRLVYHSQGVLGGVSLLMHLAAAVETKEGRGPRPAVIVAGGREPAHWEAYPGHQFIHTLGALPCCAGGGCWKSRTAPLGDGAEHDKSLCALPVETRNGPLPKCMDMIGAGEVIRRIKLYFDGGAAKYRARIKKATRIMGERPTVGLVIATFAALPYVHLGLESWKRNASGVPALVSDDCSPNQDALAALCQEYGADFVSAPFRQAPTVGDMAAYVNGLDWAKAKGLDLAVKFSRRFIPTSPWVPGLQSLASQSQHATYSQRCRHFNFGFRTECLALHAPSWQGNPLEALRAKVEANESVFVEGFVHDLARSLLSDCCPACREWMGRNPRDADVNGYAPWGLMPESRTEMPESRTETRDGLLWHDSHNAGDYARLALEYGLPYTEADFADPNQGFGDRPS